MAGKFEYRDVAILLRAPNAKFNRGELAELEAELKRKNVTYAQLVGKLADIGVVDSEPNIRNKLSRGKFTAVFLIQCLEAIGCSSLRLSDG